MIKEFQMFAARMSLSLMKFIIVFQSGLLFHPPNFWWCGPSWLGSRGRWAIICHTDIDLLVDPTTLGDVYDCHGRGTQLS